MTQCYVYKWTHIPTMSWYVGSRTAKNCHPDDGYVCSSRTVKPRILSAPNEWQREIVAQGDRDSMLTLESDILETMDALHDPRSLNRCVGVPRGIAGVPKSDSHKQKLRELNLGKKHKDSSREIMKAKRAGQIICHSDETRLKMSMSHKGKILTEQHRVNISLARKKMPKVRIQCPHCGLEGGQAVMPRWHFDRCRVLVSENPNTISTKEVYTP